ncbi:MAG: NAD-dependent deacetylase sirtuin-2-like protein, partial [Monoraphidium minutum]
MGVIRVARRRGAGAPRGPPALDPLSLEGVAEYIAAGKARHIIIMCGAGVSVSAGIPDFRTPGSGLYFQLERLNLPTPEAVFELGYFKSNPKPFHILAKELFPGNFAPSPAHVFMKLLHDKGLLLRVYTQNIDSLEHEAGLPRDRVVAAHGNFDSARCIKCGEEHSMGYVKKAVLADEICHCSACGGLVKPDIVFFGENLPERFYEMAEVDFPRADLLIVIGTSLVVHPFADLVDCVRSRVPRLLINRERVGEHGTYQILPGIGGGQGFDFDEGVRDVLYLGDADDGCRRLAALLGWEEELEAMVEAAGCTAAAGGGGGDARAAAAGAGIAAGVKRSGA